MKNNTSQIDFDQQHIWHPYAKTPNPLPSLLVKHTSGSIITLKNDTQLVDGMSSWWSAIHGYNHPFIQKALHQQIDIMPHIMFGGLTHEPAIELCKKLIELTPTGLNKVFLSDSGSVAMEVAIKMAFQYWISLKQPKKNKLLTVKNAYHGDTFATMAICDPDNGMHHLFKNLLPNHFFVAPPSSDNNGADLADLEHTLKAHHDEIAAMTIEPVVQGAGGMHFYRTDYLKQAKALCKQYNVLFIADEIATGFGRTGKLFACEWANIAPDIMTVGKALTGGTISLAATLCQDFVAATINNGKPGVLMHGPTFMGNPLACAAANASIDWLLQSDWQGNIQRIEKHLTQSLATLKQLSGVKDVRVFGAIGVIELQRDDLGYAVQEELVKLGSWLRPFGKLVYTMPAFNIPQEQLQKLTDNITDVVSYVLA